MHTNIFIIFIIFTFVYAVMLCFVPFFVMLRICFRIINKLFAWRVATPIRSVSKTCGRRWSRRITRS